MDAPDHNRPLTTGEWFLTILIIALPLIGIVMQFVWAFSDGNIGRRNFCRASLLWLAIALVLSLITLIGFLLVGALMAGMGAAVQS